MKDHQIMVFVGNGFDISVLQKYGKGITTKYASFYSFFKYRYPDSSNLLITYMEEAKSKNREDWSDFEVILAEELRSSSESDQEKVEKLKTDLSKIQQTFSSFLNDIIDSDIISKISKANDVIMGYNENCAKKNLKCSFLKDLSKSQYEALHFHNNFSNHDSIKYIFINFNYTYLFDNYLYLDKQVFDPEPYMTSNNNIHLSLNPNGYQHTGFIDPYVKMMPIDIFHPHGIQDVPKSLLFGIENGNYCKQRDPRREFVKSLWAQCEDKYADKFKNTELFIIYGCSIGESDSWWWSRIYERLIGEDSAELIIYNYGNENEDVIKEKFIKNCCLKDSNMEEKNKAKENIYVIDFGIDVEVNQEFMSLPDINIETP